MQVILQFTGDEKGSHGWWIAGEHDSVKPFMMDAEMSNEFGASLGFPGSRFSYAAASKFDPGRSEQRIACSALLFDMDGVLVDSTPAVARVWSQWAIERGFDPQETIRRAHGRPSISTIRELLPDSDHQAENRILEQREIDDLEGVVPIPGALELLNMLSPDCWALVTSSTRPLAMARIQRAGLPMPKNFITSNDITHGKPHPEPYLKAAEMMGVKASDCVVVEDVAAGIKSGVAAGARVIGLTTTSTVKEIVGAGVHWVVKDCGAIKLDQENGHCPLKLRLSPLLST